MGVILQLNAYVKSVNSNESLAGLLKRKINAERKDGGFVPETYYYITHLVNPVATYWSRKHTKVKRSNDILRKLFLGKKLERMASFWFKKLPNFITEEGKLDGAFKGIPRVRGSIDFRIGEQIIEFKTKDELPSTSEEIFEKYPQDLEQLAFYSVLDTLESMENYLVFMNNTAPYKFKAFKIITRDLGKIKSLLIERIKLLDQALEEDDCSKLGKCRYYPQCQFHLNKICKCNQAKLLPTNILTDGVSVEYDDDFTQLLQNEMEKSNVTKEQFTTINVIAPRKCVMEQKFDMERDYTPDVIKDSYIACLSNIIRKLSMNPSDSENEFIKGLMKNDRMHVAQRWLSIPSSTNKSGKELLPYTVRVSKVNTFEYARKPTQYAIAELAIVCAIYGKEKGLIFTIYPNLDDHVQVSEVIFKNSSGILTIVNQRLNVLVESLKSGEILSNSACPDWMNNDGNCPLMQLCHSKEGTGCVK